MSDLSSDLSGKTALVTGGASGTMRHCTAADIERASALLCADTDTVRAQALVVDGGYSL